MQIFVKTLTGKTITLDVLAVSPLMIEIFDSIVSHSFGAHWKHQNRGFNQYRFLMNSPMLAVLIDNYCSDLKFDYYWIHDQMFELTSWDGSSVPIRSKQAIPSTT